jgi:glycosyltransferase involved in cell wall biosynthesis
MKIMVAAASFSSNISGIQRHALNMVRCLLRRPEISGVDLVVAPWQTKLAEIAALATDKRLTIHVEKMEESSISRNRWYYVGLPALASRLQVNLVHLTYPVPVNVAAISCPTVVTLHDFYPFEIPRNFHFPQLIFNRLLLKQCLKSVDAIACVSETTLLKMQEYAPRSTWEKAIRIYNCVEPESQRAALSPLPDWQEQPFLLSVAQHRRNKNIPLLIKTFHDLHQDAKINSNVKLVVIGIDGPETEHIHRLVSWLKLEGRVLLLKGLSEPELQWCYTHCEVLVAPSKTEGFGLPVVEGLLAGCRVVCSDIGAFREIGGEHCRFFALGLGEKHALAAAIHAAMKDRRGISIDFPQLSAEALSHEYIHLYRQLLSSKAAAPVALRSRLAFSAEREQSADEQDSQPVMLSTGDEHGCI